MEVIYRVRQATQVRTMVDGEAVVEKYWAVLTDQGNIRGLNLDQVIQAANTDVRLALVRDDDGDRIEALMEFLLGTSDSGPDLDGDGALDGRDSDRDGLDDRFEYAIGWTVQTTQGQQRIRSSPANRDTDLDGLTDAEKAPILLSGEIDWVDGNGNGRIDSYQDLVWTDRSRWKS